MPRAKLAQLREKMTGATGANVQSVREESGAAVTNEPKPKHVSG